MARIHEHLYRSHDLSEIDMAHYIQNLVDHLQSFYGTAKAIITVDVAPEISLDIQTAIPCGLCINELVINALKYAFPAKSEGESRNQIQVKLYANDAANYTLAVKDNGVGLPANFDWQNASSLGLQLVRIFSQQLGGAVTLNNDAGTTFSLVFPKPNLAEVQQ
jgi:two-component sensor histidine kinase